jgi:hypothetical protein
MRLALVASAAALSLALLAPAAQAKSCGRHAQGSGSGTSAARVVTRNLSCERGVSILDRWFERADSRCSGGRCPVIRVDRFRCTYSSDKMTTRCVRGRRVARAVYL